MKELIKSTVLILIISVIAIAPQEAYACSCLGDPPPCEAFSGASAIFVGKVIGAAQQKEETDRHGNRILYDVGTIRFSIQEAFLGVKGPEEVIHSGTGGADCGYWFRRGESYLVYAYGKRDHLSTSICTRTRPISEATEDLAFLRNLPAKGIGGTLYGTVRQFAGDLEHGPFDLIGPMAGIKVIIEGEKQRFQVITNDEGEYRMIGLPPGSYDVKLELPDNLGAFSQYDQADRFGSYSGHKKISIYDRGCVQNSFTVQLDGRISGIVTDIDGNPLKEIGVDLVNADSPDKSWSAWTDVRGYYEFRMVQPGRYLLGVNIVWVPEAQNPYSRTYFPSVSDPSRAMVIGMGEGSKLQGYGLILPPRFTERTVEGTVIWPDGRPGAGASIMYELSEYPGKSLPKIANVDERGRFSAKLLDGQSYRLYAQIDRGKGKYMHSEAIEVIAVEKMDRIKLILNKQGSGINNIRIVKKKSQ